MSSAWYALRRTIPAWSVNERLPELVAFCRRNRVDEVIAKVDSEEFTHGLPTVAWLEGYLPILRRVKEALEGIAVAFSINPWVTLVHCDRGRDTKAQHPNVGLMVGHDGTQCKACACPLSEGWRNLTRELWRRYASLEPNVIWVEDDIRLLNHQPVEYGCFCTLHLEALSEKVGENVTRTELVEALLAPGEPHPYRPVWLDLNRDVMIDTGRFLERCVHEVSPTTKLGLMCSSPTSHAIEGRDWRAFTSALAGDQPLYARPCMSNYSEGSPRGLYNSEYLVRSTMHCLGPDATVQTEVENWPFTGYSKSARFTSLQCALSFILGADGVTLNLFDHMGTPMSIAPEFGDMLRTKKPFLNALAERCRGGRQSGIQLIHPQDGSYHVRLPEKASYRDLSAEGHAWRRVLEPLGFPITFDDSPLVALSGQVVGALPDERIRRILSAGALVDLTALQCLIDMGYGDLLGASVKRTFRKYDEPLAAEEYFNEQFGGEKGQYLTLTLPDLAGDAPMAEIVPAAGSHVLSHIVDPDATPRYPFLTLYENSLRGRVAIYPIDIEYAAGPAFLNPYRKRQMEAVLRWLSRDEVPLIVSGGAYPLPFRIDQEDQTIIGASNLSLDPWPDVTFDVFTGGRRISTISRLDERRGWVGEPKAQCKPTPRGLTIKLKRPLPPLSLLALSLWWR